VTWGGYPLIDLRNLTDLLPSDTNSAVEYKITSFIVEDLNNDELSDILLGVDAYSGGSSDSSGPTKTIIIRAL
jgi:hypothetical protein